MPRSCPSCGAVLPPGLREEFCAVCTLQGALDLPATPGSLPECFRQIGDYELIEELARGGVGVVYRARQLGLGREVAVKVLIAGQFADATARQRFRTEAEAAARLRHPHIVEVYEVGEHEGQPFLALEYMPGGALDRRVRSGPLPAREAALVTLRIARAVQAAHDQGILHRDLKPSNILLDALGEPRVADFGLAKLLGSPADLTLSGQVLGSPGFMAPEQARGRSAEVTTAADIYSLGALLYHLTTTRPPFQGDSAAAVLRQVERDEPIPPRRLNPGVPRDLDRIIRQCLEKTPARRYPTAAALADDLQRFLAGHPVHARPLPWPARLLRWSRRRPGLATSIGLLSLLAAGSTLTALRIARAEHQARLHLAQATQNAYAGDLALADRAIEDGDLARTRELLEGHLPAPGEPDLRTFEWRLLWHLSSDQATAVLRGHTHAVTAVVFLRDGSRLASGSWDGSVRFWSLTNHVPERTLDDYQGRIWSLDVSPDGQLLAASGENGLAVWQTRDGFFRGRLAGNFGYGMCRFLPDGRRVVVATRAGAGIWDLQTGDRLLELPDAASPVALSPDGSRLAARNRRGLTLFDTATWKPTKRFTTGTRSSFGLRDLAFSGDARRLLVGDTRGWLAAVELDGATTNLTDIPASRVHPQPHLGWVGEITVSPDARLFATVGADQSVLVWRGDSLSLRDRWRGHRHEVWAAAFSPDNRWLATGGKDETIRLWNLEQPVPNPARVIPVREVLGIWGPREVLVQSPPGPSERRLRIFDWDQRRATREITLPETATVSDLHFQPATHDLALRHTNGFVAVWNLDPSPPRLRARIPAPAGLPGAVRLSPDGRTLASYRAGDHGSELWTVDDARLRLAIPDTGGVVAMDSEHLVCQPTWETPRVFDIRTGRRLADLTGHKERVSQVILLPDHRTVVTAGWDGTLRFWSLPDGRPVSTTRSQRQGLYALALSPDGRTLVAGGQDGVTHFWNVPTRQQTTRWVGRRVVERLWFTPDGEGLVLETPGQVIALRVPAPDGPDTR